MKQTNKQINTFLFCFVWRPIKALLLQKHTPFICILTPENGLQSWRMFFLFCFVVLLWFLFCSNTYKKVCFYTKYCFYKNILLLYAIEYLKMHCSMFLFSFVLYCFLFFCFLLFYVVLQWPFHKSKSLKEDCFFIYKGLLLFIKLYRLYGTCFYKIASIK